MSLDSLNAWDKVAEAGKELEPFSQVVQGLKETSPDLLQRLTSTVERSISDPSTRKVLIESLAFENASTECKEVIRPLMARSAAVDGLDMQMLDLVCLIQP